jgi:protein-L-isoaspartate O-methyltransferase
MPVLTEAFDIINLDGDDVLVDVGSGDGRVVLVGSKIYDCESIGIEKDKNLVDASRGVLERNRVEDLVEIRHEDALKSDLSEATVLYLYHQKPFLEKLKPQIEKLKPGTVILCLNYKLPWLEMKAIVMQRIEGHEWVVFYHEVPGDEQD